MLEQVAQILEDLFDIPASRVEHEDDLEHDWGMTIGEKIAFNKEICAEFNISSVPTNLITVQDYIKFIDDKS